MGNVEKDVRIVMAVQYANINVFDINVSSVEEMGYANMVEAGARAKIVTVVEGVNTEF
jgi:hypothetical protein